MGDVTAEIQREHRTVLIKEFAIIGSFYLLYSLTRNRFGSIHIKGSDIPLNAFHNAMKVIRLERAIGLYHEESIQEWFLSHRHVLQAMNTYYGTAHFVVTLGVFFVLFKKRKDVFRIHTRDHAEYLCQANDKTDMLTWIRTIGVRNACQFNREFQNIF